MLFSGEWGAFRSPPTPPSERSCFGYPFVHAVFRNRGFSGAYSAGRSPSDETGVTKNEDPHIRPDTGCGGRTDPGGGVRGADCAGCFPGGRNRRDGAGNAGGDLLDESGADAGCPRSAGAGNLLHSDAFPAAEKEGSFCDPAERYRRAGHLHAGHGSDGTQVPG